MPDKNLMTLAVPVNDEDHAFGVSDAPVTLVEYGDFECSHCGQAYPIVKDLQERLAQRLRFVFRSFPLTESHPHALHAAEAAEAAAAQGRFWQMHDALFEHQRALGDRHLARYAADVGLNATRLEEDLRTHAYQPRVREVFAGGVRSGVRGTPTFFINGIFHAAPWDLRTLLDALRAAMSPRRRPRRGVVE